MPLTQRTRLPHSHWQFRRATHGLLSVDLLKVFRVPKLFAASADYLHAECTSAVFGFVDDLELHLRIAEGVIAVRSASRLGYSDLGVNRRRIEDLRALLIKRGIVGPLA
ncbi:MAG: hypothetical protein K0Q83_950 [Deltaproteobacteria bacterium]|nr:hypothetical protein [Deltaproteobacteria bacterium]